MVRPLQEDGPDDLQEDVVSGEPGQQGPQRNPHQPTARCAQVGRRGSCRSRSCCRTRSCRSWGLLKEEQEGALLEVRVLGEGGELGALLIQKENLENKQKTELSRLPMLEIICHIFAKSSSYLEDLKGMAE